MAINKDLVFSIEVDSSDVNKEMKAINTSLKQVAASSKKTAASTAAYAEEVEAVDANLASLNASASETKDTIDSLDGSVNATAAKMTAFKGSSAGAIESFAHLNDTLLITDQNLQALGATEDQQNQNMKAMVISTDDANRTLELLNTNAFMADNAMRALSQDTQIAQQNLDSLNAVATSNVDSFYALNNSIIQISATFNVMFDAVKNVMEVIEKLTTSSNLDKLSKMLNFFSVYASIKGNTELAASLDKAGNEVAALAEYVGEITEEGGILTVVVETLTNRIDDFAVMLERAALAGKVLAAVGVAFLAKKLNLFQIATQMASEKISGLSSEFNVLKTAVTASNAQGLAKYIELLFVVEGGTNALTTAVENNVIAMNDFFSGVVSVSGMLSTGLLLAVNAVSAALGGLLIKISEVGFEFGRTAQQAFLESEKALKAFEFTVTGFGNTFGRTVIGTYSAWSQIIDEAASKTTQSIDAIRKASALLIKESQILGLTFEQNAELLKAAIDLAATVGGDVDEITRRLLAGMTGQKDAVITLGINVSNTSLELQDFAATLGKTTEELTQSELVQGRFATTMKQLTPLIGAANAEMNTYAGLLQNLESTQQEFLSKIGLASSVLNVFVRIAIDVVSALNQLPPRLLSTIGLLTDLGSALLGVIGIMTTYITAVVSIASAQKFLTVWLFESTKALTVLNSAFQVVASTVGASIPLITNWKDLLVAARAIGVSSLAFSLGVLVRKLKDVVIWIKATSAAILTNPLFIKVAAIVAGISAVTTAISDLNEEFDRLAQSQRDAIVLERTHVAQLNILEQMYEALTVAIGDFFAVFQSSIKFIILGLRATLKIIAIVGAKIAAFVTGLETFSDIAKELNNDLMIMGDVAKGVVDALTNRLNSDAFAEVAKSVNDTATGFAALNEQMAITQERIQNARDAATTDPITAALKEAQRLNLERARITEKIKNTTQDTVELLQKKKEIIEEQLKAWANVEAGVMKILDSLESNVLEGQLDTLQKQNRLVERQVILNNQRLKAFDKQAEILNRTGVLTERRLRTLRLARQAILDQNAELIKQAKIQQEMAKNKALNDIISQNEKLAAQLKAIGDLSVNKIDQAVQARLAEVNALEKSLEIEGLITDEMRERLNLQRELIEKQGEAQKKQRMAQAGAGGSVTGQISGFGDLVGNLGEAMGSSMVSSMGQDLMGIATQMGASIAMQILNVVLAIPAVFDSISGLVDQITNFPLDLANSITGLLDSFMNFIKNFLPNMIAAIEDIIMGVVDFILELPEALSSMLESLPDMIMGFFTEENFRKLGEAFMDVMFLLAPKLALVFMKFLVRDVPKLVAELVKMMPQLAVAFVNGMIDAIIEFGDMFLAIFGMGGFNENLKKMGEGFESMAADLAKSTEDAFKVLDLEEINSAEKVGAILTKHADQAVNYLKMWWDKFLKLLKDAWMWVYNKVIEPFISALSKAWEWFKEKILHPMQKLGQDIWNGLISAAGDIFNFFENLGTKIWHGLLEGIRGLGKVLEDIFNGLQLPNLLEKLFGKDNSGQGTVEKALSIDIPYVNFASGGMVQGTAIMSGDSLRNDTVPAMLSPGEFVVPRSVVNQPGVEELLMALMGGGGVKGYGLGGFVKAIAKGNIAQAGDELIDTVQSAGSSAADFLSQAGAILGGGLDAVKDQIFAELIKGMRKNVFKFSSGGAIPGFSSADTVNNIGQPGEFVMNHMGRATLGDEVLNAANKGKNITGSSENTGDNIYNLNVNVNAQSVTDERKLANMVMENIKRESARGKWIVDTRGLRTS